MASGGMVTPPQQVKPERCVEEFARLFATDCLPHQTREKGFSFCDQNQSRKLLDLPEG